jgi:hypothetical protein
MYAIEITSRYTKKSYLYPVIYLNIEDAVGAITGESKRIKQIPQARSSYNVLTILKLNTTTL